MSALAREVGMTRAGLYKALSQDGNPSFATVVKVARALGLEISVKPLRRP
jgi:probable addiction module antidote protein